MPAFIHRHAVLLAFLTIGTACRVEAPTATPELNAPSAKSPSGGGGTTASVTVTAASPAVAPSDTTVDVLIDGSGFVKGAQAKWSLLGDTTKVHVLSTTFVSSSRLSARVQVPANAPLGAYDIEVYLVGGKKGVGAELFEVVLGDPKTTWLFPLNASALSLRSDGLYADGTSSVYDNGVCGVSSRLFSSAGGSGSGDATMQTDNPTAQDKKCAAYPRTFSVVYADGLTNRGAVFMNLRVIQNRDFTIAVGDSTLRGFAVSLSGRGQRCSELRWNDLIGGVPAAGHKIWVKRVNTFTWAAHSQAAPNNLAVCIDDGRTYPLDVAFTVVARSLP